MSKDKYTFGYDPDAEADLHRRIKYLKRTPLLKKKELQRQVLSTLRDKERTPTLPPPTAKEIHSLIHPEREEESDTMGLKDKLHAFKSLSEASPLEAPVAGFNKHVRDMSPTTREMILKAKLPEIMSFCDDRNLNPMTVGGCCEAAMRLGRIPDLNQYGLVGDDAVAVKDFLKDFILNLAESVIKTNKMFEAEGSKARHLKLASDYKQLADFHKRRAKEETDRSRSAKEDGKPHTSIEAEASAKKHSMLADHCSGLADYHQLQANRLPAEKELPTEKKAEKPVEPPQGAQKELAPKMEHEDIIEATMATNIAAKLSPVGQKQTMTDPYKKGVLSKPPTLIPEIEKAKTLTGYTKWAKDDSNESGTNMPTEKPGDEGDTEQPEPIESIWSSRFAPSIDKVLDEAKKKKPRKHKPLAPDKARHMMANIKVAPLFHELGHKMDNAESKVSQKPVKKSWCCTLQKLALEKGGSAAADQVLAQSLTSPWIRDQGFCDEASNLRRKWETAMSAQAQNMATNKAPTEPEPLVFAVNKMLKMSEGTSFLIEVTKVK